MSSLFEKFGQGAAPRSLTPLRHDEARTARRHVEVRFCPDDLSEEGWDARFTPVLCPTRVVLSFCIDGTLLDALHEGLDLTEHRFGLLAYRWGDGSERSIAPGDVVRVDEQRYRYMGNFDWSRLG